jgi:hypothetical protein
MIEDRKEHQIALGRQAASIEEPLQLAAEQVKNTLLLHMLETKDTDDIIRTRQLYHAIDKIVQALANIKSGGDLAEHELKLIEQRRHQIFNIA